MMILSKVFSVTLCLVVVVAATPKNESCDFSGIDLDYAVSSVLTQLPSDHLLRPTDFAPFLPGIEVGIKQFNGFDKMTRYGPVVPYCVDGKYRAQVDLINSEDISIIARWKACSGQEGEVIMRNTLIRLTVQFRVDLHPVARAYRLEFVGAVVPVISAYPSIVIEGAGPQVRVASMWLSKIFPAVTRSVWNNNFLKPFSDALRGAARNLYGGGPRPDLFWERLM